MAQPVPTFDRAFPNFRFRGDASADRRARRRAHRATLATRIVSTGALAYAALFVFAAVIHFVVFKTARPDLGNMVQSIWSTLHGHFLEMTTPAGHQLNRLAYHVDPFLLVFVPFFYVWSSPLLLVVFQALAVTSGVFPVYWLARKHLGSSRAGAHFAFAYLLYPATQFNAFTVTSSYHSVAIAIPLVLYAIWFLDEDRLVLFGLFALLAATTKEEIPLAVGCLGIWYAVRRGRRGFGATVFVVGLAATLFDFLVVIHHYSPSGVDPFVGRYKPIGSTPRGMAHTLVHDPTAFVHDVATGHKLLYLVLLLLPFVGFWALEPLLFLGAVPDFVINLLSTKSDQTSIPFHWTAGIVPFVVAASIFGAARFKGRGDNLSLLAFIGCAVIAVFSPIYLMYKDVGALWSAKTDVKAHALSLIPSGVPVAASNQLGGHLSERRYIYTFPNVQNARWIIVDDADPTYSNDDVFKTWVRRYEADPHWLTVYSSRGVAVLRERPGA